MCQKSSRSAGYNCIFSLQAAASTSLCAGSGSGASWAPPASPPQCRAATGLAWSSSWKAARQGQELAHGCVFLSVPGAVPAKCCWLGLQHWGSGDGISSSWYLPCCAPVHFWHLPEHDHCCQRYPWCSSHFSPSSGWVHSLFFCLMVKKIYILFFILVSLAHAAEGGRGSFWRRGRGGLIDDPGWRWRTGWRAASRRTAVWALPGRKSLEHSAASFLEHLLLQKQSEKMLFEYCTEGKAGAGRGCTVPPTGEWAGSQSPGAWLLCLCCAHDNLVLARKFLPQLGHAQCENTMCTGLSHTWGTPFVVFAGIGHTLCLQRLLFCLNAQYS